MTEIIKFRFEQTDFMKLSDAIRREVFIEEQHVDPVLEYEYEELGHYYLLFNEQKPIATCRWRMTPRGVKLERFAMLKAFRNKGLGSLLLNEVMKDVLTFDKPIFLNAQIKAVNYYQRAGFVALGDHFFEAGIEHVRMEYQKEAASI